MFGRTESAIIGRNRPADDDIRTTRTFFHHRFYRHGAVHQADAGDGGAAVDASADREASDGGYGRNSPRKERCQVNDLSILF